MKFSIGFLLGLDATLCFVFHKKRFDVAYFQVYSTWIYEGSWKGFWQHWTLGVGEGYRACIHIPTYSVLSKV